MLYQMVVIGFSSVPCNYTILGSRGPGWRTEGRGQVWYIGKAPMFREHRNKADNPAIGAEYWMTGIIELLIWNPRFLEV